MGLTPFSQSFWTITFRTPDFIENKFGQKNIEYRGQTPLNTPALIIKKSEPGRGRLIRDYSKIRAGNFGT